MTLALLVEPETQLNLYMSIEDRAAGAVMGALIGETLGVGPH